jgi:serine/threonine protein kinase
MDHCQNTYVGTKNYIAPELYQISDIKYNEKIDVFSFGVLMFYLACNKLPFEDEN